MNIIGKFFNALAKALGRLGRLMFHRLGIMAAVVLVQIGFYVLVLARLSAGPNYRFFSWAFLALAVLTVLWIVKDSSNPGYKVGWIIIVLLFHPFGAVAYLFLGGNRLSRYNQRKLKTMERTVQQALGPDCGRSATLAELEGWDAGRMARYLETAASCPVYGNTRTKYYPLGDVCYDDLLAALQGAERYIFIEYFIIEEGKLWNSVLGVLEEKARAGVDVRVIYDDMGSIFTLPLDYPKRLAERGIQCRVFNRIAPVLSLRQNNRDHRKYMIVDGRVAFTGGINMADEYINVKKRFGHWKDNAIRLEGDAVWSMTVSFLSMWDFTNEEKERTGDFLPPPAPASSGGYVQPYHDCPWDNEPVGMTVYLHLINRAREYVYITTPYLVIDYAVTMALVTAARSGVDVRIITPHIPDKKSVLEVTRSYYEELLEAGVRIFEYEPGFIHSKLFVVDGRFATVGTVNLDYRSMFLHFENGVLLYGGDTVGDIRDDFLSTQDRSLEVTLDRCRQTPLPRRLLRDLLRAFAPLL